MSFGLHDRPAVGYLVGDVHNGIAQMFTVIEGARMMVGTKSTGALAAGYLQALDYTKKRVQGADLTRAADKTAPRVTIIHHPDVRRGLMLQKAYAEGLRALYMFAGALLDADVAAHAFDIDRETASRVNDFLLPVVKGVGSERSYEILTESLQTLGGSGYLQDFPIEQYIRDLKIDALYEGTTAIQAQDFYFRKIIRDGSVAFTYVTDRIRDFAEGAAGRRLKAEQAKLVSALDDILAMADALKDRVEHGGLGRAGGGAGASLVAGRELLSIAFSTDEKYVVAGGKDGNVQMWPAIADPNTLCQKIITNMSPQQWSRWVSADPDIARYTKPCQHLPPD